MAMLVPTAPPHPWNCSAPYVPDLTPGKLGCRLNCKVGVLSLAVIRAVLMQRSCWDLQDPGLTHGKLTRIKAVLQTFSNKCLTCSASECLTCGSNTIPDPVGEEQGRRPFDGMRFMHAKKQTLSPTGRPVSACPPPCRPRLRGVHRFACQVQDLWSWRRVH